MSGSGSSIALFTSVLSFGQLRSKPCNTPSYERTRRSTVLSRQHRPITMHKRKASETLQPELLQSTPKRQKKWLPLPIPRSTASLARRCSATTSSFLEFRLLETAQLVQQIVCPIPEEQPSTLSTTPAAPSIAPRRTSIRHARRQSVIDLTRSTLLLRPYSHTQVIVTSQPLAASSSISRHDATTPSSCCSKAIPLSRCSPCTRPLPLQQPGWSLRLQPAERDHQHASSEQEPSIPVSELPQTWVCCACDHENGTNVVWCTNGKCSHYTVNCIDCFSC